MRKLFAVAIAMLGASALQAADLQTPRLRPVPAKCILPDLEAPAAPGGECKGSAYGRKRYGRAACSSFVDLMNGCSTR